MSAAQIRLRSTKQLSKNNSDNRQVWRRDWRKSSSRDISVDPIAGQSAEQNHLLVL